MKGLELHRKLIFKGHKDISSFLNEDPVNLYLYQFMREVKPQLQVNMSMADILNEVYYICIRAILDKPNAKDFNSKYLSEEKARTGTSDATNMVFSLVWILLSAQKKLINPLNEFLFGIKLHIGISAFDIWAKIYLSKMQEDGNDRCETDFTPRPAPVSELPTDKEAWREVTDDFSQTAILKFVSYYRTKDEQRALLELIRESATEEERTKMEGFYTDTVELIDLGEYLPKIEEKPLKAAVVNDGNKELSMALQQIEYLKKRVADLEAQIKDNAVKTDADLLKKAILDYVSVLKTELSDDWAHKYMNVWDEILDLDIVKAKVYDPGKQQGTTFNRNLVANIICYLGQKGAFKSPYNASRMARLLSGDSDNSVRAALGKTPDANILSRLNRHFE